MKFRDRLGNGVRQTGVWGLQKVRSMVSGEATGMNVCNFASFRTPLLGVLVFLHLHSASWSQNRAISTPSVSKTQEATVNQPTGGPVPELWVANRFEIKLDDDTPKISPSWAAFFPNGDYYPYFPEGGFWCCSLSSETAFS